MTCGAAIATNRPRIAKTTSSSTSVKPASGSSIDRKITSLRVISTFSAVPSEGKIVSAQDCTHHHRDQALQCAFHLFVVELRDAQQHRRQLAALFAHLHKLDSEARKDM